MERSTQRMVLIVATTSGFLATFMASAINIALPLIEAELRVSAVTLGWISLSYILAAGALLMPAGRLADLYGRKRFFLIGMALFTVLHLAAALTSSADMLIVLRLLQGASSALLLATTTAMVTLAYPPEARGKALGLQVAGVYLGIVLGPLLGGVLIHNFGWRSLFIFAGVLGLVDLVLAVWNLRGVEWREPKTAPFDIRGSVIWAVSLPLLLLGFSFLPRAQGFVLMAAGFAGLVAFLWWEARAAGPILEVDLLRRNRVFAYSNVASFINYAATAAVIFLMSLYLQYNRGLDPQTAGLILVSGAVVQTVFSPVSGRLSDRVQARYVASVGMAICVLGLLALVFLDEDTSFAYIVGALCILGLGFGFFATPIVHAIMGSVGRKYTGVASATMGTMRLTGQNISLGLATMILAIVVGRHRIVPADYSNLLTSVRITFAIFTVLCALGVAASLVGPRGSTGHPSEGEGEAQHPESGDRGQGQSG